MSGEQHRLSLEPNYIDRLSVLSFLIKYPGLSSVFDSFLRIPVEFRHNLMVSKVTSFVFTDLLIHGGIITEKQYAMFLKASDGVVFHDIGKLGVVEGSIYKSLGVFYENDSNINDRNLEHIARRNTHPILSGYFILQLGDLGYVDSKTARLWAATSGFSHHENDGLLVKSSYPRKKARYSNEQERFFGLVLSMVDDAVAMSELRPYRKGNESFEQSIICNIIYMKHSDELNSFRNRYRLDLLSLILEEVMNKKDEILPWKKFPGIDISGDVSLIESLFAQVWEKHRPRLEKEYLGYLDRNLVDLTRS